MENEENFEINIDNQYIFSKHKILVDCSLKSLQTPEGVKAYAKRSIKRLLHDDVEISKIKLKKPRLTTRIVSKMLSRPTYARLYVTTKF